MPMGPAGDWKRFAQQVITRRQELGLETRQSLAEVSGLSYRLLGDVERGVRGVSEGTLAILEQELGWTPGTAQRILTGGEPLLIDKVADVGDLMRPRGDGDNKKTNSPMRALSDGYQLAAEMLESGNAAQGTRLGEVLGSLGQSLVNESETPRRPTIRSYLWYQNIRQKRIPQRNPTVLGIALGRHMRELRESKRLSVEYVSESVNCKPEMVKDLELGTGSFAEFDKGQIHVLLNLYGIRNPAKQREYADLAEFSNWPGWWTRYNDALPGWFKNYLRLEQSAVQIRTFESRYVPGLLQTPEYARAVIGLVSTKDAEKRLLVRMERQRVLTRSAPPRLWAVIGEEALDPARWGRQIIRDQIEHLIRKAAQPKITIQILPANVDAGAVAASFSLLRFSENELPDLVYTEQLTSALYIDGRYEVDPYFTSLDRLFLFAHTPDESIELLRKMRDQSADWCESRDSVSKAV